MASLEKEWTGAHGLVYYGDTLLYADKWTVQMASDTIDISNISVYKETVLLPLPEDSLGQTGDQTQPFPDNQPDTNLPYQSKAAAPNNLARKQSQYGTARLNLAGGMRQANITVSGICATYNEEEEENYLPRINNYVWLQFSNDLNINKTLFNFPKCVVKEVNWDFDVKGYMRWTLSAVSTGEFDVFPGIP